MGNKVITATDVALIKLSTFFFAIWLVEVLSEFYPAMSQWFFDWTWGFFMLFILFGVKPFWKFYISSNEVSPKKNNRRSKPKRRKR